MALLAISQPLLFGQETDRVLNMLLSRRALLAGASAGVLSTPALAQSSAWNRDAFLAAMRDSGRPIEISEGAFAAIQARRQPTLARMEAYLKFRDRKSVV